jgi:hypothetical protein
VHKLTADDGATWDWFGRALAICGNTIIAGADKNGDVGCAYVFDAKTGDQLKKLKAKDASEADHFGWSVSIDGDRIVVGAPFDDDAGSDSGSAYVFSTNTHEQLHKLTAADASAGDLFGNFVSVCGKTIVVGAPGDNSPEHKAGSAYVFNANTGELIRKLTASDAGAEDQFGHRVYVTEDIIVVGAPFDDDAGSSSGSTYVFDVNSYEQLHKLMANDAAAGDRFGWSISASGSTVVVGAYLDDDAGSESGSAYVFEGLTGEQIYKLTANDGAAGDWFGLSVCVNNQTIVVGAINDDDAGKNSGSAYVFDAIHGQQLQKLSSSDCAKGDLLGYSVGVNERVIIAGAVFNKGALQESVWVDVAG